MDYKVVFSKDEDGVYIADCIDLPGCVSDGKTFEEAMDNIKDAISGYVASLRKHHEEHLVKRAFAVAEVSV